MTDCMLENIEHTEVIRRFLSCWSSAPSSSVVLVSDDGVSVRCPKVLLVMSSLEVRSLLGEERREEELSISLPVSSRAVTLLLQLLQAGEVSTDTVQLCEEAAEAARLLGVHIEHLDIVDERPDSEIPVNQKKNVIKKEEYAEKRFDCAECDETFKLKKALMTHMKEHYNTEVVRHNCHECGKVFTNRRQLTLHMGCHNPVQCPDCEVSFTRRDKLRRHVENKHTKGGDKWACTFCEKMLSRKDKLKEHVKRRHGEHF